MSEWVADALPTALGPLKLNHDQFYALTPREFRELVAGWRWRVEDELRNRAHILAHLLQPHYKSRINPQQLFNAWTRPPTARESREAEFGEMLRRHREKQTSLALKAEREKRNRG